MPISRRLLWLVGTMTVAGLLGCQPPPPPPPPPVVTPPVLAPQQYSEVKAEYLRANPDALVGRVEAVLPDKKLLSAGDLPHKEFMAGDIVAIVNRDLGLVADGRVVSIDADFIYVRYQPPVNGGGRDPLVGDLVIRAGKPDRSNYR